MSVKSNIGVVTDGLVFYVDAANDKSYPGSGTTWTDLIGGNNGTLTNGPTFDSANGGSIVLDGTNDYVVADVAATTDSSFTYNFWINTKSINGGGSSNANIIVFNRGDVGKGHWLGNKTSQWELTLGGVAAYTVADTISTNTIYNACWVIDGTSWSMYVDGVLAGSAVISSTRTDSLTTEAYLGVVLNSDGSIRGDNSDHSVYSLGYYDRALASSEVLQNYNALKNRFI